MVIWVTLNNPMAGRHKSPLFTSNLLNMWNTKLKNINENKRSMQSIYANPSIALPSSSSTTPMVSTRGHFSLLTGKPSSLPKMHAYALLSCA